MQMLSALTVSLNKMGDLRFRMGRLEDTLPSYRRSLALRRHALDLALGVLSSVAEGEDRPPPDHVLNAVSDHSPWPPNSPGPCLEQETLEGYILH